jgi:hypothetical protein
MLHLCVLLPFWILSLVSECMRSGVIRHLLPVYFVVATRQRQHVSRLQLHTIPFPVVYGG